MESQSTESGLAAQLLIAMPGMGDPRFEKSVILMCAHSDEGAMGLIVNKPARDLKFAELLSQLDIVPGSDVAETRIYFGGPVEHGRGFVLHSPDYAGNEATVEVGTQFGMTATLDILEDIARGDGPGRSILALGYAGWGPGQLEGEIARNGWLTCAASQDLVFGTPNAEKWGAALKTLGIDAIALSSAAGRA
ncbi:MAG: YqgE/AlgH family protein [Pseudomonadota bacterium]